VVVAAIAVVLVHGSGGSGGPSANAAAANPNATQAWHDLAQCLRTHGHPGIRDPQVDSHNSADFGSQTAQAKLAMRDSETACRAELAALPVSDDEKPPTAAELHQMVLFSQCMRAHGLPDWPDPRADGSFPLSQRLMSLGKKGAHTQLSACLHFLGDAKGIRISPSSAPGKGSGK
jgi:hypothetical protein